MMSRKGIAAIIAVLVVLTLGCAKKQPSADADEGRPAKKSRAAKATKESNEATQTGSVPVKGSVLYVLVDRDINRDMSDNEVRNRTQVGDWMDEDLVRLLDKKGFQTRLIERESEFKHSAGAYLLIVRITKYNPGSKAARMFVGYGAGSASMKTHYELRGSGSSPILSDDLGVGSGRDWRNVIRKLNEQTVKAVSEKLGR